MVTKTDRLRAKRDTISRCWSDFRVTEKSLEKLIVTLSFSNNVRVMEIFTKSVDSSSDDWDLLSACEPDARMLDTERQLCIVRKAGCSVLKVVG